jgi:mRNA interferase MazF
LQRGVINACFVGKIGLQSNALQNLIPAERETILDTNIKRGDIYYADLSPVVGSEQGGVRPVLIVQNNVGNRYSPTVIAAAITSQVNKAKMPTHIELGARSFGLTRDSIVLMEQIRTLDKKRLREKMGTLDETAMRSVDEALAVSFGLGAQD